MQKIISFIQNIGGKKRYFLAFLIGCLITLALPPVYFIPAAIAGFTCHLWQLNSCQNKKQAFWLGWWFGWGFFTSGLYWIAVALTVDIKQFWWMVPFAVFGIPAVLAFYTGAVSLITFAIPKKGWQRVGVFAVLWTIAEILRGYLFTGFPWNLVGYMWTVSDNMLQVASITGIWGLCFFTVLAFAMPSIITSKKDLIPVTAAFSILLVIYLGGVYRLSGELAAHTDKMVRIVQGNIRQDQKWDVDLRADIVRKYMDMSRKEGFEKISAIVWPESAVPYFVEEDSNLLEALKLAIPKNGYLITGSMHAQRDDYDFVGKMWNSLHVIDDNGRIVQVYDKHHLVPFGEYVPFRSILPIEKITPGMTDFSTGPGVVTLPVDNLPSISPLICYEAIFPGAVVNKNTPAELMINVTNDAWYGNSSGPYQHFNMVRVRAVEEGVPLIRSANTGISGVIDAYGRVVAKTTLSEDAVLDEFIPSHLEGKTIYNQFGNFVIFSILILFSIFIFIIKF
ncbi:MAG: lnt [Rickettsiaceae bacterium]|jgi:apolipoprotein N-acyltransferase|nr:lnt [Rickettsiaceae bacterium]